MRPSRQTSRIKKGASYGNYILSLTGSVTVIASGSPVNPWRLWGLFGCFWVADVCVGYPYRLGPVVDAVPDPPARGDLVLPLLHRGPVYRSSTERASQRVLAVVSPARVVGDPLPGCPCVGRGGSADLLPSLDRCAVRVANVPAVSRRRWGDSFSPFRHRPQPAGAGTMSPLASSGLLSRRATLGSAWISAVAFHSRTNWVTGE